MVDVKDELELSIPWPLPRHEYPFKRSPHQFEKVTYLPSSFLPSIIIFFRFTPIFIDTYHYSPCSINRCTSPHLLGVTTAWASFRILLVSKDMSAPGSISFPLPLFLSLFNSPLHFLSFPSAILNQYYRCKYHVHSKCFPQVKAKSCWSEEMEGATSGQVTAISKTTK